MPDPEQAKTAEARRTSSDHRGTTGSGQQKACRSDGACCRVPRTFRVPRADLDRWIALSIAGAVPKSRFPANVYGRVENDAQDLP